MVELSRKRFKARLSKDRADAKKKAKNRDIS